MGLHAPGIPRAGDTASENSGSLLGSESMYTRQGPSRPFQGPVQPFVLACGLGCVSPLSHLSCEALKVPALCNECFFVPAGPMPDPQINTQRLY